MRIPTAAPPPPSLLLLLLLLCAGTPAPAASLLPLPSASSHPPRRATTTTRTTWTRTTILSSLDRAEGGERETPTMTPPRRAAGRRSQSSSSPGDGRRPRRSSSVGSSSPPPLPSPSAPPAVGKGRRAPHQFDHAEADARPFLDDPRSIVMDQRHNEDAPSYAFPPPLDGNNDDDDGIPKTASKRSSSSPIAGAHSISIGLDDLFPNLEFSDKFSSDGKFRNDLRNAMREDVFDSSPAYANISEKARRMLLLPDSSLQGSWRRCRFEGGNNDDDGATTAAATRMVGLTKALRMHLGDGAPTGDEFMERIGSMCGSGATGHWIDIVGIVGRRISHSWHQDTGICPGGDTRTVLLGFPKEDDYDGPGVFSHVVKLESERHAPVDHPPGEPIVYPDLIVDDEYVVRPRFARGSEIFAFRDVDILHSAPDVAYRTSVMRFM